MVRLAEFRNAGITAAAISRLERKGEVARLARGLYQLPNATVDANHTVAQVAKLVPKGVVCLISALAFHELIDKISSKVWLAIGSRDWRPAARYPPIRVARFPPSHTQIASIHSHVRHSWAGANACLPSRAAGHAVIRSGEFRSLTAARAGDMRCCPRSCEREIEACPRRAARDGLSQRTKASLRSRGGMRPLRTLASHARRWRCALQ